MCLPEGGEPSVLTFRSGPTFQGGRAEGRRGRVELPIVGHDASTTEAVLTVGLECPQGEGRGRSWTGQVLTLSPS